jgi:hypothetical protein
VDRTAARTVALAVLAVLALGVAAATLDTAVSGGSGTGLGASGGSGVGPTDAGKAGVEDSPMGGALLQPICLPYLAKPEVVLGILAGFGLVNYLVYRETRSLLPPAAVTVSFGLPVWALWAFLTACTRASTMEGISPVDSDRNFSLPEGGGGVVASSNGQIPAPTAIFGLLLLAAVVGAVALLFLSTGDDEAVPDRGEAVDDPDDVDVREVGRAAGAAADRIEADADVENEVFRAWREMTTHLDLPNPRSSTPGEFADAAVDAGMDRGDVRELTRLFEEVRYGDVDPTDDRERRAVEALRRIESAYAGEES